MAYEFQKLSDVTLAETAADTANVLVEEGGEIKRVPKREVGGASGLILTLTSENATVEGTTITYTDNYDEIYDVLVDGGMVWFDAGALMGVPETIPFYRVNVSLWALDTTSGLMLLGSDGSTAMQMICTNGSHHTPATE